MLRQCGLLGLSLVPQLLFCQTKRDTIPFVGCPADGQQGAIDPPHGAPKIVAIRSGPSTALAYYKGEYSSGVFAPRGWHCRVWYGSSGSILIVTPDSISGDTFSPRFYGPAVELQFSFGGTSGRFGVATNGSRLFPKELGKFIARVRTNDQDVLADSEFAPARFAQDSVRNLSRRMAAFTTHAGVEGLGTSEFLAPSHDAVRGLAVLTGTPSEPDLSILRVRLPSTDHQLEHVVLEVNQSCMRRPTGC